MNTSQIKREIELFTGDMRRAEQDLERARTRVRTAENGMRNAERELQTAKTEVRDLENKIQGSRLQIGRLKGDLSREEAREAAEKRKPTSATNKY